LDDVVREEVGGRTGRDDGEASEALELSADGLGLVAFLAVVPGVDVRQHLEEEVG
jgi:hypothetical protein